MRNLWLWAVALCLPFLGDALARSSPTLLATNGGRVPNTTAKQRFPRWLPPVVIDGTLNIAPLNTDVVSKLKFPSIALDSRGIAHVVGTNTQGGDASYYHTSVSSPDGYYRRSNGFSLATPLGVGTVGTPVWVCDIAVGPGDAGSTDEKLHVVYVKNPGTISYRRRTGGVWTDIELHAYSGSAPWRFYDWPQIVVDASKTAHIVASRHGDASQVGIAYFSVPDVGLPTGPVMIETAAAVKPMIAVGASGVGAVWTASNAVRYNYKLLAGNWPLLPAPISSSGSRPGLAIDAADSDAMHFVWVEGDLKVRYRKNPTGTIEIVSSGFVGGSSDWAVGVGVDALKQPHVVWEAPSQGGGGTTLGYAARILNSEIGDPWAGRQEPGAPSSTDFSESAPASRNVCPLDVAMSKNGTLHAVCGSQYDASYTRMLEPNLGAQAGGSMVAAGIEGMASANVTNGNLFLGIPVFSSQGAGYATSINLFYNSQFDEPAMFSRGWSHTYNVSLIDSQTGVNDLTATTGVDMITLVNADGRAVVFKWKDNNPGGNPQEKYHVPLDDYGDFSRIERLDLVTGLPANVLPCEYRLTRKDGTQLIFNQRGKLRRIQSLNGSFMTFTFYPNSEFLHQISDTMGRITTFTYLSDGRVDQIQDPSTRVHKFTYEPAIPLRLLSVTLNYGGVSAEKPVWQFLYHTVDSAEAYQRRNLISDVTTPENAVWKFFHYLDNRFRAVRDPALGSPAPASLDETDPGAENITQHPDTTFTYADPGNPSTFPEDGGGYVTAAQPAVELRDRRNKPTTIVFEQRKSLARKLSDPLAKTTFWNYSSAFRNLTQIKDADGNQTTVTYTHDEGIKEKPVYIKDNVRKVTGPSADATSGNVVPTIVLEENTYTDYYPFKATIKTQNPSSSPGQVTTTFIYDVHNSAATQGNVMTINHPPTVNAVTGASNTATESFTYTTYGRVENHNPPKGGTTSTVYDPASGLPRDVTFAGKTGAEHFEYGSMGNLVLHKTPQASTPTTFVPDGLFRVKERHDPTGQQGSGVTYFAYDKMNRATQIDYPNGGQTKHFYDSIGRRYQTNEKKDSETTVSLKWRYDPEGNVRHAYDSLDKLTVTFYTDRNQAEKTNSPPSDATAPQISTTAVFTDRGDVQSRTTGSDTVSFTHSARGGVKTATLPLGLTDETTYYEDGSVMKTVRKAGAFLYGSLVERDALSRVTKFYQLADEGTGPHLVTSFGMDPNGNVTEIKDPAGKTRASLYDNADRLTDQMSADGTPVVKLFWDNNDRLTFRHGLNPQTGSGLVTLESNGYSDLNQLLTSSDALGQSVSNVYKIGGELETSTRQPSNVITKFEYNLRSQPTARIVDHGGLALRTEYTYDHNGRMDSIKDPRIQTYALVYNVTGGLKQMSYPGTTNNEQWTYDDKGRLDVYTDYRGVTKKMGYDALNRTTSELYKLGTTTLADYAFDYDTASNLKETLNKTNGVSIRNVSATGPGYDVFRRLTNTRVFLNASTLGGGTLWKSSSYTYTADSQVETYTNPNGDVFTFGYDLNGHRSTTSKSAPFAGTYSTFTHDPDGRLREVLLGNACSVKSSFDAKGRMWRQRTYGPTGSIIASYTRTFNNRDLVTSLAYDHLNARVDFAYDGAERLLGEAWTGNNQGLDAFSNSLITASAGNISLQSATTSASPNPPTNLLGSWFSTYGYDAAGNRVSRSSSSDVSGPIVYDAQNRLTSETVQAISVSSPSTVTASSTAGGGYNVSRATNGVTTDGTSSSLAWKSGSAGPHTVALDYGGVSQPITRVRLFFPSTQLPTKFKVQAWIAGAWQDVVVQIASGAHANVSAPGYWQADIREVHLAVAALNATKIQFVQAADGGSTSEPNVAYLNEFDGGKGTSPVVATYDYTYNFIAGKSSNIQSITKGTTVETLAYDHLNRLIGYIKATSGVPSIDESFTYPTYGERLAKVNNLTGTNNQEWTFSDGSNPSTYYTKSTSGGAEVPDFALIPGSGTDSRWARLKADGTANYYLPDPLGGAHRIVNAAGTVVKTVLTTAFGVDHPTFTPSSSVTDPFGFAGMRKDGGTLHCRARAYMPGLGRFTQNDPLIGNRRTEHYAYAGNNPVSKVDPDGLTWVVRDGHLWWVEREGERDLGPLYKGKTLTEEQLDAVIGQFRSLVSMSVNKEIEWLRNEDIRMSLNLMFQFDPVDSTSSLWIDPTRVRGRIEAARVLHLPEQAGKRSIYMNAQDVDAFATYSKNMFGHPLARWVRDNYVLTRVISDTAQQASYLALGVKPAVAAAGGSGAPPTGVGPGMLTEAEATAIQRIANKYNTKIDVVGSRAAGRGRGIATRLPPGKELGTTRSDIDFRIDKSHPQAANMIEELKAVGGGAGSAGGEWSTTDRPSYAPVIEFTPQKK
jgi:RHS repeat-associated protein